MRWQGGNTEQMGRAGGRPTNGKEGRRREGGMQECVKRMKGSAGSQTEVARWYQGVFTKGAGGSTPDAIFDKS